MGDFMKKAKFTFSFTAAADSDECLCVWSNF
jgi:hypothetical protein